MQVETQSSQLPCYQSALLKKQRQSKLLSPKVTHVYPQIQQIQKFKIKKHHLDDTEAKLALQYDYEQGPVPKQFMLKGDRLDYDKNNYQSKRNSQSPVSKLNGTSFAQTSPQKIKINSQYYQSQQNYNQIPKPLRDVNIGNQLNRFSGNNFQPDSFQPSTKLKKSISVTDFQQLRRDQHQMQEKVINKLNQISNQTDRLSKKLQTKQQSAHSKQPLIARYKSQAKKPSVEKDFRKLKEKLQKQRTKQKQRLQLQLQKIKEENRKIKQEQKKRKQSFKQILEKQQSNKYLQNLAVNQYNAARIPVASMRTVVCDSNQVCEKYIIQKSQTGDLIAEKLNEWEKKYLPKTNVVNKRIQCQIYDPRTQHLRKMQQKPAFEYESNSDTDSQFSDY